MLANFLTVLGQITQELQGRAWHGLGNTLLQFQWQPPSTALLALADCKNYCDIHRVSLWQIARITANAMQSQFARVVALARLHELHATSIFCNAESVCPSG